MAVIEALDNGKSIRETRDADTAVVVRHLYHHAGWAELVGVDSIAVPLFSNPNDSDTRRVSRKLVNC